MRDVVFSREDVLLALASMGQLERIPFDAALVLREFPPPYTLATLLHTAKWLGFTVGARDVEAAEIRALRTPCLTLFKTTLQAPQPAGDGAVPAPGAATHRLAVVVRASEDEFQTMEPGRVGPEPLTIDEHLPSDSPEASSSSLSLASRSPTRMRVRRRLSRRQPRRRGARNARIRAFARVASAILRTASRRSTSSWAVRL